MQDIKTCKRCILDSDIPQITFDEEGICSFCRIYDQLEENNPNDETARKKLDTIVEKIKKDGKGKDYDCVVGVSGGVDSTYTLWTVVQLGLRPLAVHFDNGWDSELAVKNIENLISKLGVDLRTYVVDWEEFKQIQIAFLQASTPEKPATV